LVKHNKYINRTSLNLGGGHYAKGKETPGCQQAESHGVAQEERAG
jgi:hypothetical protein